MFDHISLAGLKTSTPFGYAAAVPFFKGRKRLDFRPGLNILVGPNGSGKSTVLGMLGESMCATQGGISAITQSAVQAGVDMMTRLGHVKDRSSAMRDKLGVSVAHDGQPVVFCDPRQAVGLSDGAFDDDFFTQGIHEVVGRGSHGQKSLNRMAMALAVLNGRQPFPTEVRRTIDARGVNDVWQQAIAVLEKRLVGTIPRGQPSLLLDEPEANCSLVWQARLWTLLSRPEVAAKFQIIVASHSAFALGIAHAHYIDTVPGFRQEAEASLRSRFAASASVQKASPRSVRPKSPARAASSD